MKTCRNLACVMLLLSFVTGIFAQHNPYVFINKTPKKQTYPVFPEMPTNKALADLADDNSPENLAQKAQIYDIPDYSDILSKPSNSDLLTDSAKIEQDEPIEIISIEEPDSKSKTATKPIQANPSIVADISTYYTNLENHRWLQVGAYEKEKNALNAVTELIKYKFDAKVIEKQGITKSGKESKLFAVIIADDNNAMINRLRSAGLFDKYSDSFHPRFN